MAAELAATMERRWAALRAEKLDCLTVASMGGTKVARLVDQMDD